MKGKVNTFTPKRLDYRCENVQVRGILIVECMQCDPISRAYMFLSYNQDA